MKILFSWLRKLFAAHSAVAPGGESHAGYAGLCSPGRPRDGSHHF